MFYSNSILLDLHVCTESDNFNACLVAAFGLKMNIVKITLNALRKSQL